MLTTAVRADGCLPLGEAARLAGFRPGTLVDVVVSRASGTLILTINDEPALDVPFRPLPATIERRALRAGRAR